MRCGGNSNPELRMALRIRSRLSRTIASGRPDDREARKRRNETSTSMLHRAPPRCRRPPPNADACKHASARVQNHSAQVRRARIH